MTREFREKEIQMALYEKMYSLVLKKNVNENYTDIPNGQKSKCLTILVSYGGVGTPIMVPPL